MKVVANGSLIQLISLPNLFPVNCYLVEEDDAVTLVDAALPFSAEGIIEAVSRLGKPLKHIVLTHAHEDHVGALDRLKQTYPDAKVAISARDAKILSGNRELEEGEAAVPIRGGVPKTIRTRPDILLREGGRIGSLQAIEAPGHTPGSMAFLDVRTNALIAGDAFQTLGGVAVAGQLKWRFPFPKFGTWDAETALASAKKLFAAKPALLAVGHGSMITDPQPAMKEAINQAERAIERMKRNGAKTGA
jgi:glyoxylase-like metal-dependent hydrolase (beta-lactamase superfamily II)